MFEGRETFLLYWLGNFTVRRLFIVLFSAVHPEDGPGRRPKHIDVVSKQRN
jgi:hypothetical protein